MNNAEKLIADINKKISSWNEKSSFSIKGVKNLSRSDLDVLILYAENYNITGSFTGLMGPRGGIEEVLKKYGLMAQDA